MCFRFSFFARVAFFEPLSFRCAFRRFLPGLDFFPPAEALPSATSMLLASPFFLIRMSRTSRGALTMVFFFVVRLAIAFFFMPLPPRPTRLASRRGVSLPMVVVDGELASRRGPCADGAGSKS